MSDLVVNPEDRFSHVAAQIETVVFTDKPSAARLTTLKV